MIVFKPRSLGWTTIAKEILENRMKKQIYVIETPPSMMVFKQWFHYLSTEEAASIKQENPELNVRIANDFERMNLGAREQTSTDIYEQIKQGLL